MNRRIALLGLSLSPVFLAQPAHADQMFPSASHRDSFTSCRVGAGGVSCSHFEGYVVVPGGLSASDASAPTGARSDAVLSANRLYLPTEAAKAP